MKLITEEQKQRNRAAKRRWYWENKEYVKEYNRRYQRVSQNKERLRERREAEQANLAGRPRPLFCEACGRSGNIVFDHCHQRGHFRGWICQECNGALGMVNDDPNILRKLIAYLERNATNHAPQLVLPGI